MDQKKILGHVTSYGRKFGFIKMPNGEEVFVSRDEVRKARHNKLVIGQGVWFRIVPDPRDPTKRSAVDLSIVPLSK